MSKKHTKVFSSLAIPGYRIYFSGLFVSNLGGWMSATAKTWLVLTVLAPNQPTALGAVWGILFGPSLLLAPLAASIADRVAKRKIMIAAQIILACSATCITYLVLTGSCKLWMLYALSLLDGCMNAIAAPAWQAFVSELVPRTQLANAISLNSASFNAARLIGPGISGAVVATFNTGVALAINVCCFVAFIICLLSIKREWVTPSPISNSKSQLREGIKYIKSRPDLRLLLFCGFMMGNFGFNFGISNSLMAKTEFGLGSFAFGALGSIMGLGALAAALLNARRAKPRLRYIFAAMFFFFFCSALAALAPNYYVFALLQIPIGICAIQVMVVANSILQLHVDDKFRGRVITLWTSFTVGGTLCISPFCGWIGQHLGPRATVWFEGLSVLVAVVIAYLWVSRSDNLRIRLDTKARPYGLKVVRGRLSEEKQAMNVNIR